jgi:hypothetical protein
MDASTFIDPIKRHPFILIGGVVAVIILIQLRSKKTGAPSGGTGVYTAGVDPNQVALQGQQQVLAAQTAQDAIKAQTAKSYIDMMGQVQTAQINAGQTVSLAEITAAQQTANAGIGASMFGTAVQGVTANYISQLKANGASNISYSSTMNGSGSSGSGGSGGSGSGGSGNSFNISNSGNWGTTTNNPAGSAVINTANTQIEQMFNNVLRAGAGIGPLETSLITDGGGSTQQSVTTPHSPSSPAGHDQSGNGGSRGDPIFVNWLTGSAMPTVTDITPNAGSPFGWVGSFVNGNTGATQTIH